MNKFLSIFWVLMLAITISGSTVYSKTDTPNKKNESKDSHSFMMGENKGNNILPMFSIPFLIPSHGTTPTPAPSTAPSPEPSKPPVPSPTSFPTQYPTPFPTSYPTVEPTSPPTFPTPTFQPEPTVIYPTAIPTVYTPPLYTTQAPTPTPVQSNQTNASSSVLAASTKLSPTPSPSPVPTTTPKPSGLSKAVSNEIQSLPQPIKTVLSNIPDFIQHQFYASNKLQPSLAVSLAVIALSLFGIGIGLLLPSFKKGMYRNLYREKQI